MIYKKTCPHCGNEFNTDRNEQIYCSRSCAQRIRGRQNKEVGCPHNPTLICYERTCKKCGWNPEVAQARLLKYLGVSHEE